MCFATHNFLHTNYPSNLWTYSVKYHLLTWNHSREHILYANKHMPVPQADSKSIQPLPWMSKRRKAIIIISSFVQYEVKLGLHKPYSILCSILQNESIVHRFEPIGSLLNNPSSSRKQLELSGLQCMLKHLSRIKKTVIVFFKTLITFSLHLLTCSQEHYFR